MMHADARFARSSLPRLFVLAGALVMIPAATAVAQSLPHVKVLREEIAITSHRNGEGDLVMRAVRDTTLEVLHTMGDRYNHDPANWYLVNLPRDPWGSRHAGWVSGRDVEYIPAVEQKTPAAAPVTVGRTMPSMLVPSLADDDSARRAETAAAPVAAAAPAPSAPEFAEVVLNFEFGKSDLTMEAKGKLAEAAAMLKGTDRGAAFSLEGHADHIGSEKFNDELGRKRAEAVRQHLVNEHRVAADKVAVISYGETRPAAPNDTREGRAQNRRVVVKLGD